MTRIRRTAAALAACALLATPALARESLGIYNAWGAFRDPVVPRCYAIAMAEPNQMRREFQPFASIGTWPRRNTRGQLYVRVSRQIAPGKPVTLVIGSQRWALTGGGADVWALNDSDNSAIVAAMRSNPRMSVIAHDMKGNRFTSSWQLAGAASAMDAALIGCARIS